MSLKNCVYRFVDAMDNIIYIGKATNLESRIYSHQHLPEICYESIDKIEYLSFPYKGDMDLVETYLIAKHRPKFNKAGIEKEFSISIPEIDQSSWKLYKSISGKHLAKHLIDSGVRAAVYEEPSVNWWLDPYGAKLAEIDTRLEHVLERLNLSSEARELAAKGYQLTLLKGEDVEVYTRKTKGGYEKLMPVTNDYLRFRLEKQSLLRQKEDVIAQRDAKIKESLNKNETLDEWGLKRYVELKAENYQDFREKCIESICQQYYNHCACEIEDHGYYDLNFLQVDSFDELVSSRLCRTEWLFPGQKGPIEEMKKLSDEVSLEIERRLDKDYGPFEEGFTLEWREENFQCAKEFLFPVRIKKVIKEK